jgi:hypothetical protein
MRVISRNPFGRYSFVRKSVKKPRLGLPKRVCAWCGQDARYIYGYDDDSKPGVSWIDEHAFCCVACFRTYMGGD